MIDMQPVFVEHYLVTRAAVQLDCAINHWNALGHRLCAEHVARSLALHEFGGRDGRRWRRSDDRENRQRAGANGTTSRSNWIRPSSSRSWWSCGSSCATTRNGGSAPSSSSSCCWAASSRCPAPSPRRSSTRCSDGRGARHLGLLPRCGSGAGGRGRHRGGGAGGTLHPREA